MDKKEHISYWLISSERDWKRTTLMFRSRDYVFALFLAHLCLEKLIKAHWVKDNEDNFPPKIHNLSKLIAQTHLNLTDDELIFCADMNKFQVEGRYPDYVSNIYKIANKKYANDYLTTCKRLRKKLLEGMQ